MSKRIAVIMAGGSGERFWPMSRHGRPKQLLRLTSPHETMLEEAVSRIVPLVGEDNVILAIGGSIKDAVLAYMISRALGLALYPRARLKSDWSFVIASDVMADH